MVDIQSKEVIDKISEDLKVQPALQLPRKLSNQIDLSYNVNPVRFIQNANGSASDTTSTTIHTTHATKDTFVVGMSLSVAKDVLATSVTSTISGQPFGAAFTNLLRLRYEPLNVGQFTESFMFPIPLKLERGSLITVTNSTAIASIDTSAIVYFYETDPQ